MSIVKTIFFLIFSLYYYCNCYSQYATLSFENCSLVANLVDYPMQKASNHDKILCYLEKEIKNRIWIKVYKLPSDNSILDVSAYIVSDGRYRVTFMKDLETLHTKKTFIHRFSSEENVYSTETSVWISNSIVIDSKIAPCDIEDVSDTVVFPNPSNGNIIIETDKLQFPLSIYIYNSMGNEILHRSFQNIRPNLNLSIENHNPGDYIIMIREENKQDVIVRKIIII